MKGPLFQLIGSGLVLGMMGGAVAIHFLHVAGAKELAERSTWESADPSAGAGAPSFVTAASAFAPRPVVLDSGVQSASVQTATTTVTALEEIVERLQELKNETHNIREEQRETNRDVLELQFRMDTHSEKFLPLRAAPRSEDQHMLLPPKAP